MQVDRQDHINFLALKEKRALSNYQGDYPVSYHSCETVIECRLECQPERQLERQPERQSEWQAQ
jgi:hypothetical protein